MQQDTALALGKPGGQQQSTVLLSLSLSSVPLVPASLSNRPSVGLEHTANEPGVIRHCRHTVPVLKKNLNYLSYPLFTDTLKEALPKRSTKPKWPEDKTKFC